MKTGLIYKGKDIADLCEITRDDGEYYGGAVDITASRTAPFEGRDITQTDDFLSSNDIVSLLKFFRVINSNYDSGLDITDALTTTSPIPPLVRKGYRPRLNTNIGKIRRIINGSTTKRYYMIKRRETGLEFYSSLYRTYGFSIESSMAIPASDFPDNYPPHILFFRMCGGGAGGEGGWTSMADGGLGGGGAGIAYGWIPLSNSYKNSISSNDFIFELFKGGKRGDWGQIFASNRGEDGHPARVWLVNDAVVTAHGGNNNRDGGGVTGIAPYLLASQNGASGGATGRDEGGDSINFSQTIELEPISWSSSGGEAPPHASYADSVQGSGGGASIGNGGDGGEKSSRGGDGDKGSGGGGGAGYIPGLFGLGRSLAKDGGDGGHSYLELYY